MKLSYFTPPAHKPGTPVYDAIEFDLQSAVWADELGFKEFWIGEHMTDAWEPVPAPDLVLAQAIKATENILLGPAGHCLPYHHPAELAHRVMQLDHMAQGRYQFGVAAGVVMSDWALFEIDGMGGQNREMTQEALDIIMWIWTNKDKGRYEGKYWSVTWPEVPNAHQGLWMKPYQDPHPPIAMTGISPKSDTLKVAGAKGYIPMSLNVAPRYLAQQWETVLEGAASTGKTADRANWRILKETICAPTDKEARDQAINGPLGMMLEDYFLPTFRSYGMLDMLKQDPNVPDSDVTLEYLADNLWLVGSPETIVQKVEALQDMSGGFGHLMLYGLDYVHNPEFWHQSMSLVASEVLPKIQHYFPEA